MCPFCRFIVLGFWLLVRAAAMLAQAQIDPTGHWEGAMQMMNGPLVIEVDVTRDAKGELAATFAQPATGLKAFPFSKVEMEGRTLRLLLKAGEEPALFVGTLSDSGKTITGDAEQAGQTTTFSLARSGAAKVITVPASQRISTALEGKWSGAVEADGKRMRLILTLANQPDGAATGTVMSPDGSGIEIPIAIKESGNEITVDVPSVGASFTGVIEFDRSELAGTWKQSTAALPITFRRSAP